MAYRRFKGRRGGRWGRIAHKKARKAYRRAVRLPKRVLAKKWANTEMIWKIALGIAIIGGVYVLYRMLVPQVPTPPAATTIVKNLSETTITVLNTTKII